MVKQFVIFDTEYTSCKGCLENGRAEWQKEEIVQIAALKIDAITLDVIEEFNVYIKPSINPVLSDFFVDLTGITNDLIEKLGISFEQAYLMFKGFSDGLNCYAYDIRFNGKGLADGEVMEKNLKYNNMKDSNPPYYINIASWLKERYEENGIEVGTINSGGTAKLLGVDKDLEKLGLDEHNALYDVYSLLSGVKFFKAKGFKY